MSDGVSQFSQRLCQVDLRGRVKHDLHCMHECFDRQAEFSRRMEDMARRKGLKGTGG